MHACRQAGKASIYSWNSVLKSSSSSGFFVSTVYFVNFLRPWEKNLIVDLYLQESFFYVLILWLIKHNSVWLVAKKRERRTSQKCNNCFSEILSIDNISEKQFLVWTHLLLMFYWNQNNSITFFILVTHEGGLWNFQPNLTSFEGVDMLALPSY